MLTPVNDEPHLPCAAWYKMHRERSVRERPAVGVLERDLCSVERRVMLRAPRVGLVVEDKPPVLTGRFQPQSV